MRSYIAARLALIIPSLFVASLLTFVMLRIVPGDTAVARAGFGATPEVVEQYRHDLGLDRPYFPIELGPSAPFVSLHGDTQFGEWLANTVRGDFGRSTTYDRPVRSEIADRLPTTIELILLSALFTIVVGVPAGILSAVRQGTPLDALVRTASIFGVSIPGFVLGALLLLAGAIWFDWAPPATYEHIWSAPRHNLEMFALPSIALAAAYASTVMRLTRSAMLDVMRHDYMRTAWAKGLRERQVMTRHALKNAMIPVVTFIGLQLITMMTGAVIIEQVFNLNGIGRLLFTAIFSRDYPMVQGLVLFIAAVVLATNLIVDVLYGWIDPRVRFG